MNYRPTDASPGIDAGANLVALSVNGAVFTATAQPGATATVAMAAPPGGGPAPFLISARR